MTYKASHSFLRSALSITFICILSFRSSCKGDCYQSLRSALRLGEQTIISPEAALSSVERINLIDHIDEGTILQWKRCVKPMISEIHRTSEVRAFITVIPRNGEIQWHTNPGTVYQKVIFGEVCSRRLQFLDSSTTETEHSSSEKRGIESYRPFAYEDAFARSGGDENDCVCRGGVCPRREGCSFWVEKRMRDIGTPLVAEEVRVASLSTGRDFEEVFSEETKCRCVEHSFGVTSLRSSSTSSAALLSLMLNENQTELPLYQFYKADRMAASPSTSTLYRLYTTDNPLGIRPVFFSSLT